MMVYDPFIATKSTDSAIDALEVTPSDTVGFNMVARALWVGGDGDVSVVMKSGRTVVLETVKAGTLLPVQVIRVNEADTTADAIVALF